MAFYFLVDSYICGNWKEYEKYIDEVKPIVEFYGGKYILRSSKVESLNENRMPDRCIVIKFPSREAIDECFSSESYRKIMANRVNNVDGRAIIVEGDD